MESYVEMPNLDVISTEGMEFIQEVLPDFNFDGFVNELARGKNLFEPDKIVNFLIRIFANEVYSAVRILTVIVGIVMISAVLENLYTSMGRQNTYNTGFATAALIMGLAVKLFSQSGAYAQNISSDLTNFMNALLPVMMTLTAGAGYVSTGVIANPIMFFMCNVFAVVFNKVLIPLTVIYLVISMVDLISDTIELGKFRDLLKKIYNFILGIIMTLFTGLLSIGSFAGVSLDSVGAKGAKFALSNMVPFVGRSVAEAMSAVASASLLLKNAVGITGIVTMLALCIIPILKISAVILCVRISAAVCEPVASRKTVQILSAVGDSLSMINASVISTAVMMIISIGIVVGLGR